MDKRLLILLVIMVFSQAVIAQLSVARIFSSNMVLQCDRDVPIWGKGKAGDAIKVRVGSQLSNGTVDSDGNWRVVVPAHAAGGPLRVSIISSNKTIFFSNVMYGDVWLCGGQSNMEWFVEGAENAELEIAAAKHNNIRLFEVPRMMKSVPNKELDQGEWKNCSPSSVAQFSAVGYFFGRELANGIDVPIGLLSNNYGGTIAEAWTSREALYGIDAFKEGLDQLKGTDFEEAKRQGDKDFNKWISRFYTDDKGIIDSTYAWAENGYDYTAWKQMELPGVWESSSDKSLFEKDGVLWFEREFELDEAGEAVLSLGPIDDTDITWINGVKVGEMYNRYNKDRVYNIEKSVLKKGVNTIVVRIEDYVGGGGMYGGKEKMFIKVNDKKIALDGEWSYQVGLIMDEPIPTSSFGANNFPSCLYNGMIAPITDFPIKGVIWYQGESDAYRSHDYRTLFPNLINDWRKQWNQPELPFIYVQLANFGAENDTPIDSKWAEIREAQDMALSLDHTAMITAIDIGDAKNIHPTNKQEVGSRLANAALSTVYGKEKVYQGPKYNSMKVMDESIEITFDHVGDGLVVADKFGYVYGFSIAGSDQKMVWAKAEITSSNTIRVWSSDVLDPVSVRYSWQDNPEPANLFNSHELPAFPFRTDDWEISTYKIKRF